MKIFISIASFCDPLLKQTISEAIKFSSKENELHFGVVGQAFPNEIGHFPNLQENFPSVKITSMWFSPIESEGCCWARSHAMSLYTNEDWFFQIDSHMTFDAKWDKILIEQADKLALENDGVVISSYPLHFDMENSEPKRLTCANNTTLVHVVKKDVKFENNIVLKFSAVGVDSEVPVKGFHVGAGCLFSTGDFVKKFPYDSDIYFNGEEQSLSARIFTHGWNIFHIPNLPVYHHYTPGPTGKTTIKIFHWDKILDETRTKKWHHLNASSNQKLSSLLKEEKSYGLFGLGVKRTMKEYTDFSGIDYKNFSLDEKAYQSIR